MEAVHERLEVGGGLALGSHFSYGAGFRSARHRRPGGKVVDASARFCGLLSSRRTKVLASCETVSSKDGTFSMIALTPGNMS